MNVLSLFVNRCDQMTAVVGMADAVRLTTVKELGSVDVVIVSHSLVGVSAAHAIHVRLLNILLF